MSNPSVATMMIGNGLPDQLSSPLRGDGWYGFKDGYQTMAVTFSGFVGRIQIEATLAQNPVEADWFPVWLTRNTPYLEFTEPRTSTESYTFQGNFVLVRFRKTRSHLGDTSNIGDIAKVMFSI